MASLTSPSRSTQSRIQFKDIHGFPAATHVDRCVHIDECFGADLTEPVQFAKCFNTIHLSPRLLHPALVPRPSAAQQCTLSVPASPAQVKIADTQRD